MLEVAAEDGDCRRRTKRCFFCDCRWRIDKKLNSLSRWCWRPRTWINWAVILISVLNVVSGDSEVTAHYTPQWAVHIEGGQEVADSIAAKHGFVNLGKIFEDFYHFEHKRLQKRSLTPHAEYNNNLKFEAQVKWAQQQVVKKRSKRDLVPLRPRSKSGGVRFNDVEWPQMWYLNRGQGLDMNVQGAWQEGISGKGVVVTILDDGLEKNHPDLVANYDPHASYDVNNHDEDPMPRYDQQDSNRHGTRCAGEVAAVANNTLCSVGVAYGANVGGVRMLDGDVTDAVEARSLSLNPQHIDIYSASWGPDDDGKTVDGPGELATRAFIEGVTKGRQGKGSIFVWASGNGGREHDNCNCDGYTNSIWTLSISSATENGFVPWYSEACSSTLATTYSSGGAREKQIVTTDLRHKCTSGHTGTSASAPLAAGICALALEANRDLTWRDMQHIVVRTAKPANLKSSDWKVNGVGRNVSHSFGYGLMDATAMVRLARTWKTVPEQHRCEVSAPHVDKLIPARSKVILNLNVTECAGVNFLEHVQAKISLSSSRRGDLQIYLTSPAGTRSTLLARRPQDNSKNPFNAWPFMSVHTWGEMPFGTWQLEVHNEGRYLGRANLQEWSLLFYGTSQIPTGAPDDPLSQKFPPKSSSNKSNTVAVNLKPNKNSLSPSYLNRKNYKNWKTKSTSSRMGKVSNAGVGANGTRVGPTVPPSKNSKTGQKSKWGDPSPRSTSASPSTHGLPLTIVLGPGGNQKVPDVFQKYPKVQQLYPLYVNAGRMYEDNFLVPKAESVASKSREYPSKTKGGSHLAPQKTERQNRFDTSSLTRTNAEGKVQNKKTPFRNQQSQGTFEGWQMIFFGTEDSPNGETLPGHPANGKGKTGFAVKGNIEDDVPNHLDGDVPGRGWKDQATRRDDVTRTTTDPLGGPSSGCASLSTSTFQCIDPKSSSPLLDPPSTRATETENWSARNASRGSPCGPEYPHGRRSDAAPEAELLEGRSAESASCVGRGPAFHFAGPTPTRRRGPAADGGFRGRGIKSQLREERRGLWNHVSQQRSRKQSLRKRAEGGDLRGIAPRPGVRRGRRGPLLGCFSATLVLGTDLLLICPCLFVDECVNGLYLHLGRCESNCPPNTYPGTDAENRLVCPPCHYTCLTCAGESEAHCTSCHDEAVPVPSGPRARGEKTERKAGRPDEESALSGRAVTKKILAHYDAPRSLFFCYPASLANRLKANDWYRRMTLLFAANLLLLLGILLYFTWKKFRPCARTEPELNDTKFGYSKINSGSLKPSRCVENILYVPSSSEED